jgi:hypothetical protein
MLPNRRDGDRIAGMGNKTSLCKTSVLNLGMTPQVPGLHGLGTHEDAKNQFPAKRDEKHSLPTNKRLLLLLLMAVVPEYRRTIRQRSGVPARKEKRVRKLNPPPVTFLVFRSIGLPRLFSVSLPNYNARAACSQVLDLVGVSKKIKFGCDSQPRSFTGNDGGSTGQ